MTRIYISRIWKDRIRTYGVLTVFDWDGRPIFSDICVEKNWNPALPELSSIRVGKHVARMEKREGDLVWRIVEGRRDCLIIPEQDWDGRSGCVSLGHNGDAQEGFLKAMAESTKADLRVYNNFGNKALIYIP